MSIDSKSATSRNGYSSTLTSSTLLGGSQAISYIIGLVRTKLMAIILGPEGIGLMSMYSAVTGTMSTLAGLGIAESGVREIAAARAHGAEGDFDRAAAVLHRASMLCGLFGLVVCVLLASPIGLISFGNQKEFYSIMLLGCVVLLTIVSNGRTSIIQGSGHYALLAKVNVLSSVVSVLPVILILYWWRDQGIVPSLILGGFLNLGLSWLFSSFVQIKKVNLPFQDFIKGIRPLISLGVVFMLTGLIWAGKDMIVRTLITSAYGLTATGIYQSAWGVSGLFVNFVLKAMGMDFYPRLTSLIHNHPEMRKCVNEQLEIGVILSLPGVLGTITCAPFLLALLYTSKFQSGSQLLAVMSCGVFFKVISYPINIIQLAKGDSKGFGIVGIAMGLLEIILTIPLLLKYGLMGAASGYALACFFHIIVMTWIGKKMIQYEIPHRTSSLLWGCMLLIGIALLASTLLGVIGSFSIGVPLVVLSSYCCLRELVARVGKDHAISQFLIRCHLQRYFF